MNKDRDKDIYIIYKEFFNYKNVYIVFVINNVYGFYMVIGLMFK